ncbi:MAG: RluA family pseudouridine synthase [Clostridia bacterium]|nr:RluA family pseudouridine synthase [Clostridia bacterium]MBQ8522345.1 RluA family pseudouridine synthase [Clostridia bacterium]
MEFTPDIVYEDNHLLVVIKPHNIAVQEDESKDDDLLNLLKNYIKVRDNKPGNVFLGLVHRLDRPTGGVMVFAKTSKCASRLTEQLKNKEMKKNYLCVTLGKPVQDKARLTCYLLKDEKNNVVNLATRSDYGAKEAILDYEVLDNKSNMSLIKVNLLTGRSHQIRVQMSRQNNTVIYGDFKYGDKTHGGNLALWAYQLQFNHPITKKQMIFKVLPDIEHSPWKLFENVIAKLV